MWVCRAAYTILLKYAGIAAIHILFMIANSSVPRAMQFAVTGRVRTRERGGSRFTILSRFFVMLVFLFCKLFEHYSQTNFPIIKTKPFKVTKYKKVWQIFRPKWVKIKKIVIILSLLLKNENKDTHYKYT